MPTTFTLAELETAVRQRADMENSEFVSDSELASYINQSLFELYDLLVSKYGSDYFAKTTTITTDGVNERFALPSDLYKLLGVDLAISPGSYVTLKPFMLAERNRFSACNQSGYGLAASLRYRLNGGYLWLTPRPAAGQTLRLWYVPRMPALAAPPTVQIVSTSLATGSTITVNGVVFTGAAANDTAAHQFSVDAFDNTGSNVAYVVTACSAEIDGVTAAVTTGGTASVGEIVSFYGAINDLSVSSSAVWTLTGAASAPLTTETDGISGWTEYVIVDAAIKCLQKEESDVSVLMAQKQGLARRIEIAAADRDAGSPMRVADTQSIDAWVPGDPSAYWGR